MFQPELMALRFMNAKWNLWDTYQWRDLLNMLSTCCLLTKLCECLSLWACIGKLRGYLLICFCYFHFSIYWYHVRLRLNTVFGKYLDIAMTAWGVLIFSSFKAWIAAVSCRVNENWKLKIGNFGVDWILMAENHVVDEQISGTWSLVCN